MKTKAIAAHVINTESHIGVYAIGIDQAMHYMVWEGDTGLPQKAISLGGAFDSLPAALVHQYEFSPWTTEVFGLGTGNQMFHRTVNTAVWPPPAADWEFLGGVFNSPPAAVSVGPEGAEKWVIVGLGTENQPYVKVFDFTQTQAWLPSSDGWFPLGGRLIYEPAVADRAPGDQGSDLNIFGVGEDRQMYHMILDVSQWPPSTAGWQAIGGCFTSPPAAVKWAAGRIDLFALGMDHGMWHRALENGNWLGDWEPRGGVFDSSPAVVSWGANRLDIFGLGTDDHMYHQAWDGSRWLPSPTGWDDLGGVFISAPTAVSGEIGTLHVFGLGTDSRLYHKFWNGSDWVPSGRDWEPMGFDQFAVPRSTLLPQQIDFSGQIVFDDPVAVGGDLHITLFRDGSSVFSGHFHDSGAVGYNCALVCGIKDSRGQLYTFSESGPVHGTFEVGSRDYPWNDPAPPNDSIRDHWEDLFVCGGTPFRFTARVDLDVASLWPLFLPGFGEIIGVIGIISK